MVTLSVTRFFLESVMATFFIVYLGGISCKMGLLDIHNGYTEHVPVETTGIPSITTWVFSSGPQIEKPLENSRGFF